MISDPKLNKLLKNERFAYRLNSTVHKAFRSYTNPSAALFLYRHFGADKLVEAYPQIETINQYLFSTPRDNEQIKQHLKKYRVKPSSLYLSRESLFPDGKIYHGTGSEPVKNIL